MQRFGKKVPWEERCFTMDFTRNLAVGETITSFLNVIITAVYGVDDNTAAMKVNVPFLIDQTGVIAGAWLQGGLDLVDYKVEYQVQTNMRGLVEGQCLLPVRANL